MNNFFVIFYLLLYSPYLFANKIDIYIRDDVYTDYLSFLDNRNVLDISNFSGPKIRRDVVDIIIAQQALALGGFDHQFRFYPGKANFRHTKMMQKGELLLSFDSYWLTDAKKLQNDLYISSAIIRNGEYLAGIYTGIKNKKTLAIKTLSDFNQLTAVSTPKWATDWETLKQLNVKSLIDEDEWFSMARMVDKGWVDFLLMPFNSTSDKSFKLKNITLVPVPNIAVLLKDSRHFLISKNHPEAKSAYKAINSGIEKLRKQKIITKAYTEAKFFVNRKNLNILNSE